MIIILNGQGYQFSIIVLETVTMYSHNFEGFFNYIRPLPYDIKGNNESFWSEERRLAFAELIKKIGATTVIEVGSWKGKSTIDIAKLLPEQGKLFSIDHWLGWIRDGVNTYSKTDLEFIYHQFLSNVIHSEQTHKIIPFRMSSKEAANSLKISADIIFFDEEIPLKEDFNLWVNKLKDNGVLCTFMYGGSFSKEIEELILEKKLQASYIGDLCCYARKIPAVLL